MAIGLFLRPDFDSDAQFPDPHMLELLEGRKLYGFYLRLAELACQVSGAVSSP